MKQKLKKFTAFTDSLLPHETAYLLHKQKMEDTVKLSILKKVAYNSKHINKPKSYDASIDKRKYSHLLLWMKKELNAIDVDKSLEWINEIQKQVLHDNIRKQEEVSLFKSLKKFNSSSFYFVKYYNLLLDYRHYLLIRMRYNDYKLVNDFLEKQKKNYENSKQINDKLHKITYDIVGSSYNEKGESLKWLDWLKKTFKNDSLDGQNRYMALIRMSFVSIKYNQLKKSKKTFLESESFFSIGKNYSKRLLLNYYDLMLVIFDKLGNYEKAIYYGQLSIKDVNINPDSIIYVNNFANVLIKNYKYEKALKLLQNVNFKVHLNKNFHAAIGFVSNQIRCLSKIGKPNEAITKGEIFFNAYRKKVLKFRWHRFFAAFLGALLIAEKHNDIIQYIKKYKLLSLKSKTTLQNRSSNIIEIYYYVSSYKEGYINNQQLKNKLDELIYSNDYQKENLDFELHDYIKQTIS